MCLKITNSELQTDLPGINELMAGTVSISFYPSEYLQSNLACFTVRSRKCHGVSNHWQLDCFSHYNGIIMSAMVSQITSLTIVYSIVYSDTDQRKHQSSMSLAFKRGIHWGPVNSPHKWPVTRKMFHVSLNFFQTLQTAWLVNKYIITFSDFSTTM